jgi:hypothetical protein
VLAYQHQAWLLFKDWCQAVGESALPASPQALIAFLADAPAPRAVALRRVRAVDAMHRAAGFEPPGRDEAVRVLLATGPHPPRYDPEQVARALSAAVIGNWPVGLVGRRDAALVAMACLGGYSHRQLAAMRTDEALVAGTPELLARLGRAEGPGPCPACAASRWLRVQARLASHGWRQVRDELADLGEVTAGTEEHHDCNWPVPWPEALDRRVPLFSAIDHHGGLELRLPLSARSMSAIVKERLAAGEDGTPAPRPVPQPASGRSVPDRQEAEARRRQALAHLAALDDLVDEAGTMAEAVLARFEAEFGRDAPSRHPSSADVL